MNMIHFVPKSFSKIINFSILDKINSKASFAHTAKWVEKEEAYFFQIAFPISTTKTKAKVYGDKILLYNNSNTIKYDLPKQILKDKISIQQTETHINVLIPKDNNWRKYLLQDLQKVDDAYIVEENGEKLKISQKIVQKLRSIGSFFA